MEYISAEEWQLLSFFDVEPQRFDNSSPWLYDDSVYVVTDGNIILSCAIHPAYRDVRLILTVENSQTFEFNSMGLKDIVYYKEKGNEFLKLIINDRNILYLQVRPSIKIMQSVKVEDNYG